MIELLKGHSKEMGNKSNCAIKFGLVSLLVVFFVSFQEAEAGIAEPTINFEFSEYTLQDGTSVPPFLFGSPVIITVQDFTEAGNGSVEVQITSTVDPVGVPLVLNEIPDLPGTFQNTNLIFMEQDSQFSLDDTGTVSITVDCIPGIPELFTTDKGNCDPTTIETIAGDPCDFFSLPVIGIFSTPSPYTEPSNVQVFCDDPFFGPFPVEYLSPTLTETGPDTGVFSATIRFSDVAADSATNTLYTQPGDVISVLDFGKTLYSNGIIIPNPDPSVAIILAEVDGKVFAQYNPTAEITIVRAFGDGPGGGGGGPIRPGLVVDKSTSGIEAGSGGWEYEEPTLGKLNDGRLILSDGFCFDLFCLDVLDYFNHLPIRQVNSGTTHTISLMTYCPIGANRCNYASVGAAPPGTDINSVNWNLILKRNGNSLDWDVTKNDPSGMLGDVTGTVLIVDASRIQYTFNIQFLTPASIGTPDGNAVPPEDNLILVTEVRDNNGGVSRNIFNEGIFVNDIYAYPQVETSYDPSVKVESLCLNEDPTDRNTCAFAKVQQWTIKQAEEKLKEIYEKNNQKMD